MKRNFRKQSGRGTGVSQGRNRAVGPDIYCVDCLDKDGNKIGHVCSKYSFAHARKQCPSRTLAQSQTK